MTKMKYDYSPAKNCSRPQEEALQSLWKQTLKSRLFMGNYVERRYVDCISDYRDLVTLHDSENELKRLLEDMRNSLLRFYYMEKKTKMWIGVTSPDCIQGAPNQFCIWAELDELAFGQYWFTIKTIRFRDNEIIVKLKSIRSIENISMETTRIRQTSTSLSSDDTTTINQSNNDKEDSIGIRHFVELFYSWNECIKKSLYEFMSKDINKENIVKTIKFLTLLTISVLTGGLYFIKYIGIFTIKFLTEFRRLVHILTPIILRLIDTANKIIGGIFIMLAMIWRDIVVGKSKPQEITYKYMPLTYEKSRAY